MDAKPWEKIIERVEEDRERQPISLKDIHVKYLKALLKKNIHKCRRKIGGSIFKKNQGLD